MSVPLGDDVSAGRAALRATTAAQYAYEVDPSGTLTSVAGPEGARTIARQGSALRAGADTYELDALGRVAGLDDLAVTYGADGQIAQATRTGSTLAYIYDETGQRIAKRTNGEVTAAYVGEAYVTPSALIETVRAGDKIVGLLRNGQFTITAMDSRGTVTADSIGNQSVASPFGERAVHPDIAEAVDYAEKGFDADLGTIRMGVRDYDPRTGRFWQPDPLFLEAPEKCVKSPVECNLYGYALGRPADYVDPTGTEGIQIGVTGSAGGGLFIGMAISGGVGVLIDGSGPHLYASGAIAYPERDLPTGVIGASAGLGVEAGFVEKTDQFWGRGEEKSVSLPLPVGFQSQYLPDGTVNGDGITVGVGMGLSGMAMKTETVNVTDWAVYKITELVYGHTVAELGSQ